MPKRKRATPVSPADPIQRKKEEIREHFTQSQKLLHRALKTPKGFARQKLGKRLQNAKAKGVEGLEDRKRINREIEALKTLEIEKIAEKFLCKTICKVKKMADAVCLPEEIREKAAGKDGQGDELPDEMIKARNNVTSGMLKTPSVQVVMGEIMKGFYIVMEIPMPEHQAKGEGKRDTVPPTNTKAEPAANRNVGEEMKTARTKHDSISESDLRSWDGISDAAEEPQQPRRRKSIESDQKSDLNLDALSKFENRLGSSDSESDSKLEAESSIKRAKLSPHTEDRPLDLSLSPSLSPQPERKSKSKPLKAKPPTKKTTFLPTLFGGYFSGSESDGSDIEELESIAPVAKKNRPGQMARRAIWEKKFGQGANHIKTGQGSVAEVTGRDDGWDGKRGAEGKDSGRGRGRGRGGRKFGAGAGRASGATGENVGPLGDGKRGLGKKDDAGVLHASWQAAKKAKDMQKTAKFEGKKVTFD
ncbi:hypothetical protein HYALB_00000703 [Hymenoscyphus albidus]|uniref:Bud22 domain-containing protein n=1 Tax=Hymenoscyphus albidus TaxID=595503 RepID=A0A9N9LQL1_9HELO|nr:hypothetical protein HYALB_00000703 [Hymenoscyphus albidus]